MFNAIAHKPVNRFPFCTYNCHPFEWGEHKNDPGYRPIFKKIEENPVGYLCKISATTINKTLEVEPHKRIEGGGTYTKNIWKTPLGTLIQTIRKPEDQPEMCVEPFIKNESDVKKYLSVPYISAQWDISRVVSSVRDVGEKGIVYISFNDPFYFISYLFDQEEFVIKAFTEFDSIKYLVDFQFERIYNDLKFLLDVLVPFGMPLLFYTAGPELATPPLHSPDVFRRLIVPYQTRLVELIHSYGYPVSLHCHGRVRDVFPYILECAFDVLEPIEPPPQGDMDLEELRKAAGGGIALMGYIQDQDFYLLREDEIREKIRLITEFIGKDTGYICCPTCTPFQHPPSEIYIKNYLAFLDAVKVDGN